MVNQSRYNTGIEIDSEDDVRIVLGRRLARPINPAIWQLLVEEEYPAEVVDFANREGPLSQPTENALADLEQRYKVLEERFFRPRAETRTPQPPQQAPRSLKWLARLVALEISNHPYVKHLRTRWGLDGAAVQRETVESWLVKAAQRSPDQAVWAEIMIPATGGRLPRANALLALLEQTARNMQTAPSHEGVRLRVHAVRYINAQGEERAVLVSYGTPSSKINALLDCVAELAVAYPTLSEAQLVTLILTGELELSSIDVQPPRQSHVPALSEVTLRVLTTTPAETVTAAYRGARSSANAEAGRQRGRALGDALYRVALFAAERNDGRGWEDVWEEWNAANPHAVFPTKELFARDCRRGYQHLSGGSPLRWKRRPGRPATRRIPLPSGTDATSPFEPPPAP